MNRHPDFESLRQYCIEAIANVDPETLAHQLHRELRDRIDQRVVIMEEDVREWIIETVVLSLMQIVLAHRPVRYKRIFKKLEAAGVEALDYGAFVGSCLNPLVVRTMDAFIRLLPPPRSDAETENRAPRSEPPDDACLN